MTKRWRDHKDEPGFVFHAWMQTVDELEDKIADLAGVLEVLLSGLGCELTQDEYVVDERMIKAALDKAEPHR